MSKSVITHTIALAAALRSLQCSHALHETLSACAKLQSVFGSASIPGISIHLQVSFNATTQIVTYKHPDCFIIDQTKVPRKIYLSQAGIDLLDQINRKTEIYAKHNPTA